jgi:hypothetical protein
MQDAPILFLLDENQFASVLRQAILSRGHRIERSHRAESDPDILSKAELWRAVIVTADAWFLRELFRLPNDHRRRRFNRAGILQVPGETEIARSRLEFCFPVIEAFCQICRSKTDQRVGIDLRPTTIFLHG